MQIFLKRRTNNLFPLTILTVNHLALTDFEGFPVSHNCSEKTIEGQRNFTQCDIYRGS